ncbi:MAG TPA: DUF6760 family protein [Dehalococcoidia bacterium]|nr:DUF6760 family protein [Dehalococcoidia bacterium]
MPGLRRAVRAAASTRGGAGSGIDRVAVGGIARYPLEELQEEVAFLGYYMHWPLEQLLALEHAERRQWAARVSGINRRLNDSGESQPWRSWTPDFQAG